jgi:FAD/FMN-containing dehydrogenase
MYQQYTFIAAAITIQAIGIAAAPSQPTVSACAAIAKALPGLLTYPGAKEYKKENSRAYNIGVSELKPACVVTPTQGASQVAQIVKIFNEFPDVKFAVKSGGHDPNFGHSSVHDGVLVSLSKVAGVKNDLAKGVAYVQPGGSWNEVIAPLGKEGKVVVGGRLGM